MTDTQSFVSDPNERAFFAIIPHIADDDLNLYEYRLYGHYVKVCGMCRGVCEQSVREMADKLGMGPNKLMESRDSLRDKGYIRFVRVGKASASVGEGATYAISIVSKWTENMNRYAALDASIQERPPNNSVPNEERNASIQKRSVSNEIRSVSNEIRSVSNEIQRDQEVKKEEKELPLPATQSGRRSQRMPKGEHTEVPKVSSSITDKRTSGKLTIFIEATTKKTLTNQQRGRLSKQVHIEAAGGIGSYYPCPEILYEEQKGFSQFVLSRLEAYKAKGEFDLNIIIGDICNYGRNKQGGQPGWLAWKTKHTEFTDPLPDNAAVPIHQQRTMIMPAYTPAPSILDDLLYPERGQ